MGNYRNGRFRHIIKALLFPGINLHARLRYRIVPEKYESGTRTFQVLDAGCGNGMLSYAAWRRGAVVKGVSIKENEVTKCRSFFNDYKGIPEAELNFSKENLQDIAVDSQRPYDAIICADVLEHICDDFSVLRTLAGLLRPGACIHITAPNADHPYNASFPLDREEKGGHVRAGYNEATIRALVQPLGLEIEEITGFGGPIRQAFNRRIKEVQKCFGPVAGLPLFFLAMPFLPFDSATPRLPYSLYVRIRKPALPVSEAREKSSVSK